MQNARARGAGAGRGGAARPRGVNSSLQGGLVPRMSTHFISKNFTQDLDQSSPRLTTLLFVLRHN